ncbi:hypothetical protein ACWGTI_17415 [Mesorhizobium sp. ArgA1]
MQALSAILIVFGFIGWAVAMWAALAVWRVSPPGEKFGNYVRLGSWRFAALEARLGPGIRQALSRFRLGIIVFLACLVIAIATGLMTAGDLVSQCACKPRRGATGSRRRPISNAGRAPDG